MSTNDFVVLLANGLASIEIVDGGAEYRIFEKALEFVCISLAKMIVRNGEGATKIFEVKVMGAKTEGDARRIARSVTKSNLVKTALYGASPNWGRILAAMGSCGVEVHRERISIYLGEHLLCQGGRILRKVDSEKLKKALSKDSIKIMIHLGEGKKEAVAWGCDLSPQYVRINAK
jgi:glutamate N-acetyltransferase/amino-acid N-acetyltransferase